MLAAVTATAAAENSPKVSTQLPAVPLVAAPAAAPSSPPPGYCAVVGDKIAADQAARDREDLQRLIAGVDARVADLEAKTLILKDWVARRDAFVAKAQDRVVQIYGKMQPEAAAVQLAVVSENVAAAIVMQLEPKQASAVLAEMAADKAARLSSLIAQLGELGVAPKRLSEKEAPK
jgi:flagellar motility protein MotE (MotC chaperone)